MKEYTNIYLVGFKMMPESRFKEMLDFGPANLSRDRLDKILAELKIIAQNNDLVAPLRWMQIGHNEEIRKVKTIFGGEKEETWAEYTLYLQFKGELSEEDFKMWWLTVKSIMITLNTYFKKD